MSAPAHMAVLVFSLVVMVSLQEMSSGLVSAQFRAKGLGCSEEGCKAVWGGLLSAQWWPTVPAEDHAWREQLGWPTLLPGP